MPTLRIDISDDVWPMVLAVLESAHSPRPLDVDARTWAERVAAEWFAAEIAGLSEPPPPPPPPPRRRTRPFRSI